MFIDRLPKFPAHGCHGDVGQTAGDDCLERFEIIVDIQRKAMIAYPAAYGYAYRGNFTPFDPDPGFASDTLSVQVKVCKSQDQDVFKATQKLVQVPLVVTQVDDGVPDQLPRGVQGDVPATTTFHAIDPVRHEVLRGAEQVFLIAVAAKGYDRRMF